MELALFTAVPFMLAMLLAVPWVKDALDQSAQTWLTSLAMAGLFFGFLGLMPQLPAEGALIQTFDWAPSLGIALTFYLDGLSLIFALVITGIGALVFFYAGHYFDDAAEHSRFMVWLLGFAGAMLGLVLSGNLLMMFVAWELTSAASFMLIGFTGDKDAAARAGAFKALFVTAGGGLALIIGLVMLGAAAGQLLYPDDGLRLVTDLDVIFQAKTLHQHPWFPAFAILIVLGGLTKSAQFPFHFWLPAAMTAPTPASAYLHSATMVKAGIFLFLRLSPLMYPHPLWSNLLLSFGLLTMLIGSCFAIKQRDLKGLLAYSTISKLGAIVAMIGLPGQNGLKAAFVGIIAHALYKSALFLVAGVIDHAVGTRRIDRLGGLRRRMPLMFWVTVISALSMAGMPFLLGFVAKETLLDAMLNYSDTWLALGIVLVSSALTALVGYMLIYDVFWKAPRQEPHFHAPPALIGLGPLLLSLGSLTLGFLVEPVIVPLLTLAVPKEFELHLFEGFNDIFGMSMGVLLAGGILFRFRKPLIRRIAFPFSGDAVYQKFIQCIEWAGDRVLSTQSGFVRYYLAIILGAVSFVLVGSGTLTAVTAGEQLLPSDGAVTITDLAKIFMLFLTVAAGLLTVVVREHVRAAIAFGVIGYAIGVIFLIEHAPDVALVQMLVETMATVLIIIMLGRISSANRRQVMKRLWLGRHRRNYGLLRDIGISVVIGLAVFVFALIALQNRPERSSIAAWHLENTAAVAAEDVVGAIVASFRGTDTLLEIAVFTTAALGVLTLLSRGRQGSSPLAPRLEQTQAAEETQNPASLSTPFTRSVSYIVLPIAILIGIAQILYGGSGPGDGFTAGVTIGLAVSLWYVVLGYFEAKRQLPWFRPAQMIRLGLVIAVLNALFPLLLGKEFMGHIEFDRLLGIYDAVGALGLHVTSALIFEIAIAITVMGGLGIIMEVIAYPNAVQTFADEQKGAGND